MKKLLLSFLFALILLVPSSSAQTQATFYTTMGTFVVEFYDTIVPITAGNFITLARQEYFDGIIFHRVIDDFMIQGGDPTGTGSGGPGYTIPDEFDPSLSNVQKTISMANSGPNTGGSQFFINLVDNTYLDYNKFPTTSKHAVFGIVIQGFDVVQDIGKVATNSSNKPLVDVVMDSVRLTYDPFLGIETLKSNEMALSVVPNPTRYDSYVSIESTQPENVVITIMDPMGKVVTKNRHTLSKGTNKIPLNSILSDDLNSGVYLITVQGESVAVSTKMMILD